MRNCSKQDNNGNVVNGKQDVAAFQVKEEKLLLQDEVLPDPAYDEGIDAVKACEGKDAEQKDFS